MYFPLLLPAHKRAYKRFVTRSCVFKDQRLDNETSYNQVATPEIFSGAATLSLFFRAIVGIIAFMVRSIRSPLKTPAGEASSNSEFMFMQTQVGIFRLISCFFVKKFS